MPLWLLKVFKFAGYFLRNFLCKHFKNFLIRCFLSILVFSSSVFPMCSNSFQWVAYSKDNLSSAVVFSLVLPDFSHFWAIPSKGMFFFNTLQFDYFCTSQAPFGLHYCRIISSNTFNSTASKERECVWMQHIQRVRKFMLKLRRHLFQANLKQSHL